MCTQTRSQISCLCRQPWLVKLILNCGSNNKTNANYKESFCVCLSCYIQLQAPVPARCVLPGMSQASLHGRWTVSSSDDDDDEDIPPSATTAPKPRMSPSPVPEPTPLEVKAEPVRTPVSSSLTIGSEARQSAARNQLNPVKFENSPSLAGKRKKEASDGSGWALSDSDEDDAEVKNDRQVNPPKRAPPNGERKKAKKESERPPSPHGRLYYIDEPDDFFESSVPCLNDTYRFYLNKVTGLDRKYNSGALHIRGEGCTKKITHVIIFHALMNTEVN